MNARIYSHNHVIGKADLNVGDRTMGHVYGTFVANAYYQNIQNIVWKFNSAIQRNFSEWTSLALTVQLENGCFLFPVGGIEIEDLEELPKVPKRIDIAGLNSEVITDYFETYPSKAFVLEPWIALNIERKFALEGELQTEISINHILANCDCSALCASLQCDDVLFAIHNEGDVRASYALVHLTWSNHKEQNPKFPSTTLFNSFEEFKEKRMSQDKIDFES